MIDGVLMIKHTLQHLFLNKRGDIIDKKNSNSSIYYMHFYVGSMFVRGWKNAC
jgi:hypothetical protein